MGDPTRFRLMADLIADRNEYSAHVADVASGRGQLQAELYRRGFGRVVSWDVRGRNFGPRRNYRGALFDYKSAPRGYDLVAGMHPDGGTDHIVCYAIKHRVSFVVCPCCVIPSATHTEAIGYSGWIDHLVRVAEGGRLSVRSVTLPMTGRNLVLVGEPIPSLDGCRAWGGRDG